MNRGWAAGSGAAFALTLAALAPVARGSFPVPVRTVVSDLRGASRMEDVFPGPRDLPPLTHAPDLTGLPDPLILEDGTAVTSPKLWERRRLEMKRIIAYYLFGRMPPPPGNVAGTVAESADLLGGRVRYRGIRLSFGPGRSLGLSIALFTPAGSADPCPVIVNPSFDPTPSLATTAESAAAQFDGDGVFRRGYGVASYLYTATGPDDRDAWSASPILSAYPAYDWHDISLWAWITSRVADYLLSQPDVDRSRLILLGHSRLGKAAAWAGANDERFAIVAAAGSSGGGIELSRLAGDGRGQGKEGLADMARAFPGQFGPHLSDFMAGRSLDVDRLPFDGHWLVALAAPRCFLSLEADSDQFTDGQAVIASVHAALPVFNRLGVRNHLGIHFRPGGHSLAPADWKALLDFADGRLFGRPVNQRFDLPAPGSEGR
ncbi:MAG TPA: hypothetical protein VGF85_02995 [Opitutaceae bacterium]